MRTKGVFICDSIFAPATVTISDSGSAMFVRNPGDTINSYYLYAFGTDFGGQGKQGYSVTAGEKTSVDLAEITEEYKTSKIKISGKGIQYNGVVYAGNGENVSLALGEKHSVGMICGSYSADKGTLTGSENPYTLAMPAENVVVTANFIPSPFKVGDVNRDSYTNINDVTMIQMYLADLKELDDDELVLANTNGDTKLDIEDATHLQNYLAEFDVELAEPTPPIIEPPTEPTTEPLPVSKTVRFVDTENWQKVYLFAYDSNGNELCGEWPGTRITDTETNDFDETLFVFTIPEGAYSILINDSAGKLTTDITDFDVDGYYLTGDIDENGRYCVDWWKEDED